MRIRTVELKTILARDNRLIQMHRCQCMSHKCTVQVECSDFKENHDPEDGFFLHVCTACKNTEKCVDENLK